MNAWESFHFLRPAWLVLLPLVCLLWWWREKQQDPLRGWRALLSPELLSALRVGPLSRAGGRTWGLLLAWILAALALAGPTWRLAPSPFADDPIPLMIVMAAHQSMEQSDLAPRRLDHAQRKIADLADERKGQPLGLVAYAGSAHLVLPPTRDTDIVASMAAELSPAIMPRPGDDLAQALTLAADNLAEGGGSLLVVTDDVSQPDSLEELTVNAGIQIQFLAVARDGSPELENIETAARTIGGRVERWSPDRRDVQAIVRQAARVPVAVAAAGSDARFADDGWWLVVPLAILALVPFRREQRVPIGEGSA